MGSCGCVCRGRRATEPPRLCPPAWVSYTVPVTRCDSFGVTARCLVPLSESLERGCEEACSVPSGVCRCVQPMRVRVCVCMCVYVCACVHVRVHVHVCVLVVPQALHLCFHRSRSPSSCCPISSAGLEDLAKRGGPRFLQPLGNPFPPPSWGWEHPPGSQICRNSEGSWNRGGKTTNG